MKYITVTMVMVGLLLLLGFTLVGLYATREDRDYAKIQKLEVHKRTDAYYEYLKKYPNGKFVAKVKEAIHNNILSDYDEFKKQAIVYEDKHDWEKAYMFWRLADNMISHNPLKFDLMVAKIEVAAGLEIAENNRWHLNVFGQPGELIRDGNITCRFGKMHETTTEVLYLIQKPVKPGEPLDMDSQKTLSKQEPAYSFSCTLTNTGKEVFYFNKDYICVYTSEGKVIDYNTSYPIAPTLCVDLQPGQTKGMTIIVNRDRIKQETCPTVAVQLTDYVDNSELGEKIAAGPFMCTYTQKIKPN